MVSTIYANNPSIHKVFSLCSKKFQKFLKIKKKVTIDG